MERSGVLSVLVLALAFVLTGCMKAVGPPSPPPQERGSADDYRKHEEWFRFQRMYPNDTIPTDARRKAWEALKRQQAIGPQLPSPSWSPVGPASTTTDYPTYPLESGRINSVAVSPANPQVVLLGSASGGIWRSTDAGRTFIPVSDDQVDLAVGSISFSASSPSVAYAGMGDPYGGLLGTGVLKSTDEGQTWTRIDNGSLTEPGTVTRIRVDPTNSDRVYLAQYGKFIQGFSYDSGFYFSADGGVSWTNTLAGQARDLVISPINPKGLYLTMTRVDQGPPTPPTGLYESLDGGATWTSILSLPYDQNGTYDVYTAVSTDGQTIYAYSGGTIGGNFQVNVMASSNAGQTWSPRSTIDLDSGNFGYDSYLEVDPTNSNTVYLGSRDVYRSTDGGSSWTNLTHSFTQTMGAFSFTPGTGVSHCDQHALTFIPGTTNAFYIGNDGGLSLSTDDGSSFISLNSSLSLTQFYGLALDPSNPNQSYGGAQDNGIQRRVSGGTWNQMLTGDGARLIVNPVDTSMIFGSVDGPNIFRFRDNGRTFDETIGTNTTFDEPDTSPRVSFIAPFANNGVDQTLYFGTWRLFKSLDLGDSWTSPAGATDLTKGITSSGPDTLTAIGVVGTDPNVIYTGSVQGRVMLSSDGGSTWTDITGSLPNRSITWIAVDGTNPSRAYITFSGYLSGHVFTTANMGSTWTDISGNLPDLPANTLLIDPRDPGTLYMGDDIGVFQSIFGGSVWQPFNTGLPPAIAGALVANASALVQVGTYGRGAYQITPPQPQPGFGIIPGSSSPTVSVGKGVQVQTDILAVDGFTGPVSLAASVAPANPGVAATFTPSAVTVGGSSTLDIMTSSTVAPGNYTITMTGTSGAIAETTVLTLTVTGPDFFLAFSQPTITADLGSTVDIAVLLKRTGGFADRVEVSTPGSLPTGVKVKGASQIGTKGTTATFKLKIATAAVTGSYPLTFAGTDSRTGRSRTAQVSLLIQ
jgi:photosystem II stability/assembly factor-like uncharacterized protein